MANGGNEPRPWGYWSEHKLEILRDYLAKFALASQSSPKMLYLDLFAGAAQNVSEVTGQPLDGSARIALETVPKFSKLRFFELPNNAQALRDALERDFAGRNFEVIAGDCNETIHDALRALADHNEAPTFAFVDQQSCEVKWATLEAIARFKASHRTKPEQWILWSPQLIKRNLKNSPTLPDRVDAMVGTDRWRQWLDAEDVSFSEQMTNLLRWRLEQDLGYRSTHAIPMHMSRGPLYDMVFATDHEAGNKIMTHLYKKASERQPDMINQARIRQAMEKEAQLAEATGADALFEVPVEERRPRTAATVDLYRHEPPWDPFA